MYTLTTPMASYLTVLTRTHLQQIPGSAFVCFLAASSSTRTLCLPSSSYIRQIPRWSSVGALNESSKLPKNKTNAPKSYSSISNDLNQRIQRRCFLSKMPSSIGKLYSRAFADRFVSHISTQTLSKTSVKLVQVPKVAVGPDEPEVIRREVETFLDSDLPCHPRLYRGELGNGLRYVILPNKDPPNRFEAHMRLNVGSIDEEDDEQGIAHMLEHVAIEGTEKEIKIAGFGAYTGFQHTVYHIDSPTLEEDSDGDLLPDVLVALKKITFHPKFFRRVVEKERKIILSELQMYNTIEDRVEGQLMHHLHSENKLGRRAPIGLKEQIKIWDANKIRKFHQRWYFPSNATLYIVGDIGNISKTIHQIEGVFGQSREKNVKHGKILSHDGLVAALDPSRLMKKRRHAVRPPVLHNWSVPANVENTKPPQIFQHELLQNFSISMCCKTPVDKVQTYRDLRNYLMESIYVSALEFRFNTRCKSSTTPPLTSFKLYHGNEKGEWCKITTLTIEAEPHNWHGAVGVAVQEVRRMKEFGLTKEELKRHKDKILTRHKHSKSVDYLEYIMNSDAVGNIVMDQIEEHESLVAATITLEEVNSIGNRVIEFISDFGHPSAPLPAAIVASVPEKFYVDGKGETEFVITPDEITKAIRAGLERPIEPVPELDIPDKLISESHLEQLLLQRKPSFVPFNPEYDNTTKNHDTETGITQRRLSNGISVNYKVSTNCPGRGVMELVVGCGHAAGSVALGVKVLEGGCVGSFSKEQVEIFCMKHGINFSLYLTEETIVFSFDFPSSDSRMRAAFQLLHMVLEHSVWSEDAFDRSKQEHLSAYRSLAKSLEGSTYQKLMLAMFNGDERFVKEVSPKSMDNLSLESVRDAVLSHFFGENMEVNIVGDFSEEAIESCILDYVGTVRETKCPEKVTQVIPVIFEPFSSDLHFQQVLLQDTDERSCAYIGVPTPSCWGYSANGEDLFGAIKNKCANNDEQPKSGKSSMEKNDAQNKSEERFRSHPLFFNVTFFLLAEIIYYRLRDLLMYSLGLTYDVSWEMHLFDRLSLGWYVISVTSTPELMVYEAVDACKKVFRGLRRKKLKQWELDCAKETLLEKHGDEIKSNIYWLRLMEGLQASSVPRMNMSCIKDLTSLYDACTIADIYLVYEQLKTDDNSLYTCIGISGPQALEKSEVQEAGMKK